ncbi:hypothetical protein AQJ23_44755 [Streptomyces antibioticus]|nr:hypothetical protein AQJ23_44755 [Streptomyces antibioticus]
MLTKTQLEALTSRTYTPDEYDVISMMTLDSIRGEVGDRITDPPQPGIRSVALTIAARVLVNAAGVSSEQAGGMLISYFATQIGKAITADERRTLRRAVGLSAGASSLDIAPRECGPTVTVWRAQ